MDNLNMNNLLNRDEEATKIKMILKDFEENKHNLITKRGLYIYGDPGSGKTTFIVNILKEINYDVIKYDAGDVRNKSIIDTITKHNMADRNIMSMFEKKVKRIAIIMDEIDGMNNGDKGGINTLIKLIRPKKTKKQKLEEITMNPIICIGNYHIDKKIKELMKVCNTIELKTPTTLQINTIVKEIMPELDPLFIQYIQGDLKKLHNIWNIYQNKKDILQSEIIQNVFQLKTYNDDTKQIVQKIITQPFQIEEHNTIMNETDRTIIGLLWHENIIEVIDKMKPNVSIPFYIKQLDNICFADYIDRITFQKQIWQFNEMSSLIKTFKNNHLYHSSFKKKRKFNVADVRFTKVLTKFSTEYNNTLFIQNLCQQLAMDKKDVFAFFLDLKSKYNENELVVYLENYEITKLDINRIYRYINKYTNDNIADNVEFEIDSSDDED